MFLFLPCQEYCSPVWCSAADSQPRLLDGNLNIRFLIQGLAVDLWYQHSISSLCMLFKIYHKPKHPFYSDLPGLFHPARITREDRGFNNFSLSVVRSNTTQFFRSLIKPAKQAKVS